MTAFDPESVQAYPLQWPTGRPRTEAADRRRAAFGKSVERQTSYGTYRRKGSLTVHQAAQRVYDELTRMADVDEHLAVISTNLRVRLDGGIIAKQRQAEDPGAAVYFRLNDDPHCVSCDKWDRVEDNIAAIAKHIEALRGMERWGCADLRQAFAGFRALPDPGAQPAMTVEAAARWFVGQGCGVMSPDSLLDNPTLVKMAYRQLAQQHHPDRGGSQEAFVMLTEAKRVLDAHHQRKECAA